MTGRPISPPKMPGLVIEKVLSCTSSGLSFLGAGALGQIVDGALQAQEILLVRRS